MKRYKRMIAYILAFSMCFMCREDQMISSAKDSDGDILCYYDQTNNEVVVSGSGVVDTGTGVGELVRDKNAATVTFSNGITGIGNGALSKCESIKTINLADSTSTIGNKAFALCVKLKKITIPQGVKKVGNNIFTKCFDLRTINNLSDLTLNIKKTGLTTKWTVGGVKKTTIKPHKTAHVVPQYCKVKYKLHGGKLVGKKVKKIRYGKSDKSKLPTAKKKGYVFSGWYPKGGINIGVHHWSEAKYGMFRNLWSITKPVELHATYKKITVKRNASGDISINMKSNEHTKNHAVAIEYADNKDMKNAKYFIPMSNEDFYIWDKSGIVEDDDGNKSYVKLDNDGLVTVKKNKKRYTVVIHNLKDKKTYIRFRNTKPSTEGLNTLWEPYGKKKV